ncbi:ATP-dependent DNA helicase SRS2-like protein [Prunus yedoensis var. nudiflora]|uniref:ATP-dependent DNA helicase SRS2-like protein n=1 Tax=Prunus yedoensis var. nudiflora TaxID=2094558 RepID=A0A314UXH6_PRUYE|nr:ATP-dependent DNA helicase SRS2-like protein [Prunus yedoensis var. nudiflora]
MSTSKENIQTCGGGGLTRNKETESLGISEPPRPLLLVNALATTPICGRNGIQTPAQLNSIQRVPLAELPIRRHLCLHSRRIAASQMVANIAALHVLVA